MNFTNIHNIQIKHTVLYFSGTVGVFRSRMRSYVTTFLLRIAFWEGVAILVGYAIRCHGYFDSEIERKSNRERESSLIFVCIFPIRCSLGKK